MRGELSLRGFSVHRRTGSSPLARGTPQESELYPDTGWFIPACAGNSISGILLLTTKSVHPRLRGELRFHLLGARFLIGSSPLARGTRLNTLGSRFFRRFIPACAGNSLLMLACNVLNTVHPRLRGELVKTSFIERFWSGSSPLARGTPTSHITKGDSSRFIPACAGNSLKIYVFILTYIGSSPLARGTRKTQKS